MVAEKSYLKNVIRYIHLNPVYHRFTLLPEEWLYSSYHAYIGEQYSKIPRDEILQWFGGMGKFIQFHLEKLDGGLNKTMGR